MNSVTAWTCVSFVLWFVASWVYHGLGITLGYHRLLTHKSLKVPKWLMYVIVSGGYFALMGAPIVWVGVHRLHHQKSDQEGDPHSPVHGFAHALYEWMFNMRDVQSDEELQRQCPDLMQDKLFRALGCTHSPAQAQLCLGLSLALRALIFVAFGWVPLLANVAATTMIFWATQLVNTICHMPEHGYRRHVTREESRNVWWVAFLTHGEGWHNTHHASPRSARHGIVWYEFDVTWYATVILEKLGLAKDIVRFPAGSYPILNDADSRRRLVVTVAEEAVPVTSAPDAVLAEKA